MAQIPAREIVPRQLTRKTGRRRSGSRRASLAGKQRISGSSPPTQRERGGEIDLIGRATENDGFAEVRHRRARALWRRRLV